jgi:hypothetical protein
MSESRPLLKTTPTRQTYLTCPETVDPFYRGSIGGLSKRRYSSSSLSLRQTQSEDNGDILRVRRSSNDSITETLNYSLEDTMNSQRQPTDSVAYVQRLEKFFDRFSSSLYLENHVAVARDHLGKYAHTLLHTDFRNSREILVLLSFKLFQCLIFLFF